MPIIQIHLLEGRTEEQKRQMVKEVTDAVCRTTNASPDNVKIIISDMSLENYASAGVLIKDLKK